MAASIDEDKRQVAGKRYPNLTGSAGTAALVGGNAANFLNIDVFAVSDGTNTATIKPVTRYGCAAPTASDYSEDAVGSRFYQVTLDSVGKPTAFAEWIKTGLTTWKNITA
jgi:hypothetical protein